MYYYMNPRRKIMVLQFIILIGLIIIVYGINRLINKSDNLDSEISSLDLKCPKCPNLTNPIKKGDLIQAPAPECPECPSCPSVPDIVSGIFPGRNAGLTRSGKHFDVKSKDSYDLLPDYSFYKAEDAFPKDSILDPPLRWANIDAPLNDINNSIDNNYVDTNSSASQRRHRMGQEQGRKDSANANASRMSMAGSGSDGINTSTRPKSGPGTTARGAFSGPSPSSAPVPLNTSK